MIPLEKLKPFLLFGALVLILLNLKMMPIIQAGEYPSEGTIYVGVVMSLLPAALLILALRLLKGGSRTFKIMLGVMAMMYAAEFVSDPYSLSLFMDLNLNLWPIFIYTIIGSVFLLIAVYAFKQV